MNLPQLFSLLCAILLSASYGLAQPTDSAERAQQKPDRRGAETRLLQQLLHMEAQQLAHLRETIERIEQMTSEEKAQLRGNIGTLRNMPPEKIDAMRKQYKAIPQQERQAMRERWLEMSPEQRAEWRRKLRQMSHAERKAVFEQQGFLPPPPQRDKQGPRAAQRGTPPAAAGSAPSREKNN
jgi:hypothetical protein